MDQTRNQQIFYTLRSVESAYIHHSLRYVGVKCLFFILHLGQKGRKTISKWECGNGFPEASLLLPLCNELEITVNELLTGERISQQNYKKKAEENMVNMIREKEQNKQKTLLTTMIGVISTITFLTLLLVVCFYTDVITLPIKMVLMVIAISVFGVGLYVAMWGDRKIGYFKCRNCNELCTPTFMQYNMGMHLLSTRYLKCPHCKTKTWCKKVMTKEC